MQTDDKRARSGAEVLYATSKAHRRVVFLELMAWAICEVEADASGDFREELKQHRAAVWGRRPWPGAANDEGQFLKHVEDMARVFAGCDRAADAWYPNRKRGPLVGQDLRSS